MQIAYCDYKIDKYEIHKTQDKLDAISNDPQRIDVPEVKFFIILDLSEIFLSLLIF